MPGCVEIISPAGWCELSSVLKAFSQGNMALNVLREKRNADTGTEEINARHFGK